MGFTLKQEVHNVEADLCGDGAFGAVRAAPRGAADSAGAAAARSRPWERDDPHGPGGRSELLYDHGRVRRGSQAVRGGMRQGGRRPRDPLRRRHAVHAGELQARRPAEREARAICRDPREGHGHAPDEKRHAYDRDQDGRSSHLIRCTLGAALALAAFTACRPAPSGYTLLFLGRSPAAHVGDLSWAPDADHSRLIAFDGDLHVVRIITDPRISSPVGLAPYPGGRLLITERTGE